MSGYIPSVVDVFVFHVFECQVSGKGKREEDLLEEHDPDIVRNDRHLDVRQTPL